MKSLLTIFITLALFASTALVEAQREEQRAMNREAVTQEAKAERGALQEAQTRLTEDRKAYLDARKMERETKRAEVKEALDQAETEEERKVILDQAKAYREEMKAEAETKRAEFKTAGQDIRNQRNEMIAKKFQAVITRSYGIIDKIQARLSALEEQGTDISSYQSQLDSVSSLIVEAESLIEQATLSIGSINRDEMTEEEVKSVLENARSLFSKAKETVADAWEQAKELVGSLKELTETE